MEEYIGRPEHDEFLKRMEEEHRRHNRRLEILETNTEQMHTLVSSVERLAVNMENMLREQEQQGKRLEALENRDGEKWREVTGYIATAIIGIVIGYIFNKFGIR